MNIQTPYRALNSNALASDSILQNMFWANLEKTNMAQADREAAQSQVAAVAGIEDAFTTGTAAINTNVELSAQGRANALLALSKKSIALLDSLTAPTLAALDVTIVGHTNALRKAASGPDGTLITELRAQEARAVFATVDELFQPGMYLDLCASGADDNSCVAVENASGFAPLLKADVIEAGRKIRGARSLPDQAAALDTAVELKAILSASVSSARRNMGLGVTADPLQVASLGNYPIDGDQDDDTLVA